MAAWGAIASGVATLASSAIGTYAQNRANANLNIHNRRWQEDMFKKETDYNTMMWNKQNEYNTASAQRSRLEQAGLNPYLMMNGADAGTASSVSSPSAGTPSTIPYDYSQLSQGVSDASQSIISGMKASSEIDLLREQKKAQEIDNAYKAAMYDAELDNKKSDTKGKDQHTAYEKYLTEFGLASFNSDMLYKQYQNQLVQNNAEKALQDSLVSQMNVGLLAKELEGFDVKRKAELQQMAASTYAAYASGHLSYESAKTQIASRLLMAKQGNLLDKQAEYVGEQTNGQRTTNWINKKSANFQAARIMHEMNEARWRATREMNNSAPVNPWMNENSPQKKNGIGAPLYNFLYGTLDLGKGFFGR